MRRSRLRPRALAAAAITGGLLLAVAIAACGDGDPASTAVTPAASAVPVAAGGGDGVVALDRFHYVATLTLREQGGGDPATLTITTEGDFQQPDRHDFTYLTERDGRQLKRAVVLIGDDAWLRDVGGEWQALTAGDPQIAGVLEVAFSTARARFLAGPELARVRDSVRALPSSVETINGVSADHYRVGGPGEAYFESFVAGEGLVESVGGYAWDLWLATDGGWPVRLQMSAAIAAGAGILEALDLTPPVSYELSIDVSRPDDSTIEVVPPLS